MVLKRYIRIASMTICFLIMVFLFSCEKPMIIRCSDCLTEEPLKAKIEIILDDYSDITVTIYEGNLEDSIIYEAVTTEARTFYRSLPLNRKYTLTATYYDRGNCYVAVNSITPHVLYDENFCEEPCYYIYNNKIDMRIKYTKYGGR